MTEQYQTLMTNRQNYQIKEGSRHRQYNTTEEVREQVSAVVQITLFVRNMERMCNFYQTVLQIEASSNLGAMHVGDYRFLMPTGILVLTPMSEDEQNVDSKSRIQLTINVGTEEGVNRMYALIKSIPDCVVRKAPHYSRNNRYQLLVDDPEGNTIMFCE